MVRYWLSRIKDRTANGMASGKESMMVTGCRKFSNCEARTMYMKIAARKKASRNSLSIRPNSLVLPFHAGRVAGRHLQGPYGLLCLVDGDVERHARQVGEDAHLALAVHAVDLRGAGVLDQAGDVVEAHQADLGGGHVEGAHDRPAVPELLVHADAHLIELVRLPCIW